MKCTRHLHRATPGALKPHLPAVSLEMSSLGANVGPGGARSPPTGLFKRSLLQLPLFSVDEELQSASPLAVSVSIKTLVHKTHALTRNPPSCKAGPPAPRLQAELAGQPPPVSAPRPPCHLLRVPKRLGTAATSGRRSRTFEEVRESGRRGQQVPKSRGCPVPSPHSPAGQ